MVLHPGHHALVLYHLLVLGGHILQVEHSPILGGKWRGEQAHAAVGRQAEGVTVLVQGDQRAGHVHRGMAVQQGAGGDRRVQAVRLEGGVVPSHHQLDVVLLVHVDPEQQVGAQGVHVGAGQPPRLPFGIADELSKGHQVPGHDHQVVGSGGERRHERFVEIRRRYQAIVLDHVLLQRGVQPLPEHVHEVHGAHAIQDLGVSVIIDLPGYQIEEAAGQRHRADLPGILRKVVSLVHYDHQVLDGDVHPVKEVVPDEGHEEIGVGGGDHIGPGKKVLGQLMGAQAAAITVLGELLHRRQVLSAVGLHLLERRGYGGVVEPAPALLSLHGARLPVGA